MLKTPNLFNFATSELSQDAFLCWLLSWSDDLYKETYPEMNRLSCAFLALIFKKCGRRFSYSSLGIDIKKQCKNIDVLCVINKKTVVVIEDKVDTQEHSNQLQRYKAQIESMEDVDPLFVYIQTGVQADYEAVKKAGYGVIERTDLLVLFELEPHRAIIRKNSILSDFYERLRTIENKVQSYKLNSANNWCYRAWQGFYTELQHYLVGGAWDYVANPSGGFLGYWWYFHNTENYTIYLQLEQDKLCFKIQAIEVAQRRALRNWLSEKIIEQGRLQGVPVIKPARFGHGACMTIALLAQDYRQFDQEGRFDILQTIKLLKSTEQLIDGVLLLDEQSAPL